MPNLGSIISSHNAKILRNAEQTSAKELCNCTKTKKEKDECPLKGKCLTDNVVYRAIVTIKDEPNTEDYVGITGNTFKTRFNQHNCDFRPGHTKKTTLSQYVSKLQDKKKDFNIVWSILKLIDS